VKLGIFGHALSELDAVDCLMRCRDSHRGPFVNYCHLRYKSGRLI
jgi:hypothetical protein